MTAGGEDAIPRYERAALAGLVAANVGLRLVYAFLFRFDTDETQHLHVAWAWAQGLVQYRDLFDNHAPLFHLLSAAPLAAAGEGPHVLYESRLAMLPLAAALLALAFALGRSLFSVRVGLWTAALAGLLPRVFLRTVEYRPDNLWAVLWLAALAVLVTGRATRGRSFAVGAILGVALAVSLKTVVLVGALACAGGFALALSPELRAAGRQRALPGLALNFAAGLALVPALVLAFFGSLGSLPALRDCVVTHNSLAGLGLWEVGPARLAQVALLAAASCAVSAALLYGARDGRLGARRAVLFLAAAAAQAVLGSLWPMWEPEHGLPYYPLLVLFGVAGAGTALAALPRPATAAVAAAVAAAEIAVLVVHLRAPASRGDHTLAVIADVLALTDRGDLVMDLKGETVFRARPVYFALEQVTRRELKQGLISDAIEARLTATQTCVAVLDNPYFPPDGRAFMNASFVPVGRVRVCGGLFDPPESGAHDFSFEVRIPSRYAIVGERGGAAGSLDGLEYAGPRFLTAGSHTFRARDDTDERIAFVWAQALERGFSPFASARGFSSESSE
ncbi:MAG TPA: hypothetical protein VMR31_12435 [Myxococcota bacterium]|nr:hypothetical protein [Myxococcota bacterium]